MRTYRWTDDKRPGAPIIVTYEAEIPALAKNVRADGDKAVYDCGELYRSNSAAPTVGTIAGRMVKVDPAA
jgi:hypothetical protein